MHGMYWNRVGSEAGEIGCTVTRKPGTGDGSSAGWKPGKGGGAEPGTGDGSSAARKSEESSRAKPEEGREAEPEKGREAKPEKGREAKPEKGREAKPGQSGRRRSGSRISCQRTVQLLAAVLFNGYAIGFRKGKIFTGSSKALCVPVLNCYSCPGALGGMPNRFAPGGYERFRASFSVLCTGDADALWHCVGASDMRFAVSVWAGAGFIA